MGVVLSSKTTSPLGNRGHLFGSMGQSCRCVGLGSTQPGYVEGWKCGKVWKSQERKADSKLRDGGTGTQ